MRYQINGQEIILDKAEVKSAKKIVGNFMKNIDELATKRHQPTYYFTLLVVMQLLSQEALDTIDPKNLAMIMNQLHAIRKDHP